MSNWQSNTIEANGIQLHYSRTGGDKPPVILAHGFSDDGLCWTPVAQALEADYDLIMVDARGHGRSEGPETGYGSSNHAADIAALIKKLELDHPAVLGHSMGAATALMLAGTYPDLPGAILLEDPPAFWVVQTEGDGAARVRRIPNWIVDIKRKTREEMIAGQRASSPSWSEAELGPWADSKLRLSFHVLGGFGGPDIDWPATVQQITCPTLLITADPEQGAIVSAEAAAELQSLLPQTKLVHIPGAGHNIRREQFEAYLAAVRPYLAEVTG